MSGNNSKIIKQKVRREGININTNTGETNGSIDGDSLDKPSIDTSTSGEVKASSRRVKLIGLTLQQALLVIKDNMTDSQKASALLKESKAIMDRGDYSGAVDVLSEGVNFSPTLVMLYIARATCYKHLLKYSEAYFDYSYAIRLESEAGNHYCYRGLCLAKMKRITMALEDLDVACRLEPIPLHFYSRASVYAEGCKYELAINDFTRAITDTVITAELKIRCLYRRALTFFEMKLFQEAITDLTVVLNIDPNNTSGRALFARTLKMVSELKRAEEQMNHVIHLEPNQPLHYVERGDIRYRTLDKHNLIEAIYDFDKAVNIYTTKITQEAEKIHLAELESRVEKKSNKRLSRLSVMGNNSMSRSSNSLLDSECGDDDDNESEIKNVLISSNSRKNTYLGIQVSAVLIAATSDLEEQFADSLFKRAQAYLVLNNNDDEVVLYKALDDAIRASNYMPRDDDYALALAICFIRLMKYIEAMKVLDIILARSPNNEKALYHYSFCQRSQGAQKDAIEGLTKIITKSEKLSRHPKKIIPYSGQLAGLSIPIGRVYETRGTLFHEMHAHKFALSDLANAINLMPEKSENYFLRGDCHCRMGNYELALEDFNLGEEKGFPDMISLFISRGMVNRLLGNADDAIRDFTYVLADLDEDNLSSRLRIMTLKSLALIDLEKWLSSRDLLYQSSKILNKLLNEVLSDAVTEKELDLDDDTENESLDSFPTLKLSKQRKHEILQSIFQGRHGDTMRMLKRIEWSLWYHTGLTLYKLEDYKGSEELLSQCVLLSSKQFSPDDNSLGTVYFFLAIIYNYLDLLSEAEDSIEKALDTTWGVTEKNQMIGYFSLGKVSY
jgi:tetratricopeptide (TPR) repeat protein